MDRDSLSSPSEASEYDERCVQKCKKQYNDIDTDTRKECSEERSSINFPVSNADKTVSSNLIHKGTVN